MTDLNQQLKVIGADTLPSVKHQTKAWLLLCQIHSPIFEKAQRNKPDSPEVHHLLGILTKAHIEASSYVESNADSIQAMYQAFNDNLGTEYTSKFEEQGVDQLVLSTHLWLYLQGYLKLDFSLANDHALNTAELVSSINKYDIQSLRTEYLQSYYLGLERSPIETTGSVNPFAWLKRLFS
ncbi:hypothetical protein [Vibrio bivalvicida]|uniref:Uncharacterized protein n=1 Tax=Vibrio bivalvicida TaxID=1276888 RepID=A0ABV4MD80_9VIBR